MSKPLEVSLVIVKFGMEDHVAPVGKDVDVFTELLFLFHLVVNVLHKF